ncbi:RNA-directed DNA polymerase, eukaryota, reverse transcriptase zinc-binding domain protein [Tanacetum coccineum]
MLNSVMHLSHMFYADDAVFMGQWSTKNIDTIIYVLKCFHRASGLSINLSKSKLLGVVVSEDRVVQAANRIGCGVLKAPFAYLGSKVGGNMSRIKSWDEIVDKMVDRLSKWKMKTLSIGGRLTLLKAVLGSMPIYHMSIFKVPMKVLQRMESIRSRFFSGVDLNSKKSIWVKWSKVLCSKEKGGLGVSSLYALNRALMCKWVWRFTTQKNLLWTRVIKAIHGEDGKNGSGFKVGYKSIWRSILQEVETLKIKGIHLNNFMQKKLGNGADTYFWEDLWHGDMVLKQRYPRLYALEVKKTVDVASKLSQENLTWSFRRAPRSGVEQDQLTDLTTYVEGVVLGVTPDRWYWTLDGSGEFSVASARKVIDDNRFPEVSTQTRWIKAVPIKVNIHAWKVRMDCLPTRLNISRRGIDIPSILCPVCGSVTESSSHLFFDCLVAKDNFRKICRWWEVDFMEVHTFDEWVSWIVNLRIPIKHKRLLEGASEKVEPILTYTQPQIDEMLWARDELVAVATRESRATREGGSGSENGRARSDSGMARGTSIKTKCDSLNYPIEDFVIPEAYRVEILQSESDLNTIQRIYQDNLIITHSQNTEFLTKIEVFLGFNHGGFCEGYDDEVWNVGQVRRQPEFVEEETLEQTRKRCKWDNDDYICRGHILNGMSDALFDVYQNMESEKELWDQLEAKYMAEDTYSKKFLVSNFNNYKMVDSSGKGKGKDIVGSSSVNMAEDDKNKKTTKTPRKTKGNSMRKRMIPTKSLRWRVGSVENLDDEISWCIDSGATCHTCKDHCRFDTFHPVEDGSVLHMGDESTKPILGRGNCGYRQVYESHKYILSRHGVFIGFGYYNNGMFMLNLNKVPSSINSVYMAYSHVVDSKLWHARLGHVHYQRLHDMSKDSLIPSFDKNMEKCNTCMLTKITRQPFKDIKRNSVLLELIHSDLCDFHATPSIGNKKYVVTYIDDASRFCYVYLLHAKDEASDKFKIYKTEVELQQYSLIKTLRTYRGGEYYDPNYFQSVGIIHQTMAPYIPQQNGVSERKNRALKEMVNSMLSYSGLSEGFWGEAMSTANGHHMIMAYKHNIRVDRYACRKAPYMKGLGTAGISVGFNFLGRDFYNALANKDQAQNTTQLMYYLDAFAGGIMVFVFRDYAVGAAVAIALTTISLFASVCEVCSVSCARIHAVIAFSGFLAPTIEEENNET